MQTFGLIRTLTPLILSALAPTFLFAPPGGNGGGGGGGGSGSCRLTARADSYTATAGIDHYYNVLYNDSTNTGTMSVVSISPQPQHGTATISSNNQTVIYRAQANYNGTDSFTYTVTNGCATKSASVSITVGTSGGGGGSTGPVVEETIAVQNSTSSLRVPKTGFLPSEIGLIVNTNSANDPNSMIVAEAYKTRRGIPEENMIYISFPTIPWAWSADVFNSIRSQIMSIVSTKPQIQALIMTSQKAGRASVGLGMSFSSALTYGYSDMSVSYARTGSCGTTPITSYYNSATLTPRTSLNILPTVVLAAGSVDKLIEGMDRGVSSDSTFPSAHGYFLRTSDANRSVRYSDFINTVNSWNRPGGIAMSYLETDFIENRPDVLFYLTGLQTVSQIPTNTFVPGALADHLTSTGGKLDFTCCQMGQLNWLDAGVVASYGTISEPCNYTSKFPRASLLVSRYFGGSSAMEAYLKSVQMQSEGHSGSTDPLARPYKPSARIEDGQLKIKLTLMKPGFSYALLGSNDANSNFTPILSNLSVTQAEIKEIAVPNPGYQFYKFVQQ
jgi:uncharacterized protein (TIGR03790 family)